MTILLAIHGWASNGDIWRELAEQLPEFAVAVVDLPGFGVESKNSLPNSLVDFSQCAAAIVNEIADLRSKMTTNACLYLVGWSLGGQLAAEVAGRASGALNGLITLATNACFVAKENWPLAMPAKVYEAFRADFAVDPTQTTKRFHTLQAQGASDARLLRAKMRDQLAMPTPSQWPQWARALLWLEQDTRNALGNFTKPQLHLFSDNDALVPPLLAMAAYGEIQILRGASHCLPIDSPERVARAITVFIKTHRTGALDKRKVAQAFSAAADSYDAHARVQKITANRVLARLTNMKHSVVLDVGSGTGILSNEIAKHGASVVALDIAQGMLSYARARHADNPDAPALSYLAADAEYMPIDRASIDLIVSNLAIQWCADLERLFAEFYRVLKPGGHVVLTTLGPATLQELKAAWQVVDACVHVNAFASQASIQQAVERAGLIIAELKQRFEVVQYKSLMPLLQELKAIGAHNSHASAPAGLMTRGRFKQLVDAYPRNADSHSGNCLGATYEVFLIELTKPLIR
jgi:malonyl-CoA O-methyltransferase